MKHTPIMRKLFITLAMAAFGAAQAQIGTPVSDSIEMGATYLNDVYYDLNTGTKTSAATNTWHLAFRTGAQTDGIRINSATATGANEGTVSLYLYPSGVIADWASFDTTGWENWLQYHNSDESWEVGAFNVSGSGFPDFSWGVYDMSTHVVKGDSLYLITYMNAGVQAFKKFYVKDKTSGNYTFVFANVDGSDEQTVTIKSSDYTGKNYMFYNLETKSAADREPASANWDFILTRYAALQPTGTYFPSTGILSNIGVQAAKGKGRETSELNLSDTAAGAGFSYNMNAIGYDWKHYEIGGMGVVWHTSDSLAYFIQDRNAALWKVVFTAFGGSANGKTVFTKEQLTTGLSTRDANSHLIQTSVYPNPAQSTLNVLVSADAASDAVLNIVNVRGEVVYTQKIQTEAGLINQSLAVDALSNGVYFVQITANGFQSVQKFVKN
ncbi:MAG: T9SS type A sorting domain-containing protein [Bacteroidetes bacterium]|nr:MAG: T9SS type A sorting domain-containing protein [Bacteroidota bacterium]